jgi:CHAT domain-containing protein
MPRSLRITVAAGSIARVNAPAVAVNHFRQVQPIGAELALEDALDGAISRAIADGRFAGRPGELYILPTEGRIPADYAVVVGLGDFRDFTLDTVATIASATGLAITQLRLTRLATILPGGQYGLKTLQATKRFMKNLVSVLALVDPDGSFQELILCEADPVRAREVAEAARGAASVLKTRAIIEVMECNVDELTGRQVAAASAPSAAAAPILPPFPYDPVPVYLDISLRGETLFYRILDKKPALQVFKKQVPVDVLADLTNEMYRVAAETGVGQPARVRADLERLGALAYSQLLSAPMRERIRGFPNSPLVLVLDQSTVGIPWELLHDRQEFLCRRFPLARRVIMEGLGPSSQTTEPAKPLRMLIVADPTGDLPGAREECRRLFKAFREGSDFSVKLLEGDQATPMGLLKELNSGGYHVLHYAGHAEFNADRPEKSAWLLADGDVTAAQIGALEKVPAVVFANACESGVTAEWGGGYTYDGRVYGLASAFLQAGVSNYIGTFWRVHDDASAHFAVTFYNEVLYGGTLGQSMQAAREAVIQRMGWNELSWAGYMLYGDPTYCLVE